MKSKATAVYFAARFSRRTELRLYAEELKTAGFQITSDWIYDLEPEAPWEIAVKGKADFDRSDALIAFTEPQRMKNGTRGGRHVEPGIALALKKRVIIVGPRENVFCHLPQVSRIPECDAARVGTLLKTKVDDSEIGYRLVSAQKPEASDQPW